MVLLDFAIFALAAAVMVKSGEWLVRALTRISGYFKVREFVIAFILMAFSTTLPELFVGITAAINKNPALALGNVIGSNIVNITLVLGIAVILGKGIPVDLTTVRKDLYYMLVIAGMPVIMLLDGVLSRTDGIILLGGLLFYVSRQVQRLPLFSKRAKPDKEIRKEVKDAKSVFPIVRMFGLFAVSLGLLFLAANFVVTSATSISLALGIAPILIGLVVVAIGTSLPELIFSARAVLQHQSPLALGDLVGAVVVNSTLVLGVTAIIFPITANMLFFFTSATFMLLVMFLFITFAESDQKLSIKEGISLILLYLFFLMIEFYLETQV